MKKAIIFDLDGTLLDTLADLHACVNVTMARFGFPTRTIDEVRAFIGNGVPVLVKRASPAGTDEDTLKTEIAYFEEYYREHCKDNTCVYDGLHELLKALRGEGYPLGVVSNKVDFATKALCAEYFGNLIDAAQGQTPDVPPKPSPISLLEAMRTLRVEDAIYVGDSDVDIMTAKAAGVRCISVSWGFRTREFLAQNGAEIIVDDACELLEKIRKINEE